jgi:site-specific recombinase XerD
MKNVKVKFYLKRNEEKADGTVPVLGRIRIGESMVQFGAKVNVPVSLWDTKSGRAIGKSKTATSVNLALDKVCVQINSAYKELLVLSDDITALDVKNAFQGIATSQETLVKYYERHNDNFFLRVGIDRSKVTYKRYCRSLAHLLRFMRKKYNVSDMPFQSLTPSFISDYDFYLRVELRFGNNTIVSIVKDLRKVVKIAINNGLVRHDPFIGYKYIISESVPRSLTSKELKKIMKAKFTRENITFNRDMFVFSCFTGVSFCDMRNLTQKNIQRADDGIMWVHFERQKTGTSCNVPLMGIPLQLMEKYKDAGDEGKLFPMITNGATNRVLKKVAAQSNVDKCLTFHMARHTYATVVTLSQGVPLETVSKMLGHTNLKTTRIYAFVNNDKIAEDMNKLEKRLAGRYQLVENNSTSVSSYIQ